jgi:hypothetical protein
MAKDARGKGYPDAFWLALDNAEASLKLASNLVDKEKHNKYLEAEQYRKKKETATIEKPNLFDYLRIPSIVDFIRNIGLMILGMCICACEFVQMKCKRGECYHESYIRKNR